MFDNMRKMVAYLLSVSFWAQLLPTLVAFFLGLPKPMTVFNIILICCLTDVFGALALMYESPECGMMERPPRNIHTHRLVDARLVWYSLFYGSLVAVGGFFNYFAYFSCHGNTIVNELGQKEQLGYRPRDLLFLWYKLAPNTFTFAPEEVVVVWEGASSVYFVTLVVAQMFHLLCIRRKVPYLFNALTGSRSFTDRSMLNQLMSVLRELCCITGAQWPVLFALVGSVAVSVFFMYISIFNKYCRTDAIPIRFWGLAVAWGLLWFALAETRKWIVALYPGSWVGRALVW
jgi:magnesium-transporting ATPase (P-type)